MHTALYVRVSTEEQSINGYSIGEQRDRLEAYAKAMDLKNIKHYSDPGFSGSNLNRPAMNDLIGDIEAGKVSHVIIWKLDRLSRSQRDTLYFVQDVLNKYSVKFMSLNENLDTSTPMGIAMIGIMSAFAELERSQIKERMAMGREARAKAGYYHGGGNHKPLGYDYVDGKLIVNPYEAQIVREMYDLYVDGNSINSTAQIIWDKYPDRIKSKTIVRDALKNNLYIGKMRFNGNEYEGLHEPIIEQKTYYKAIELRKGRSSKKYGSNKRKGLIVGKAYCSHCGARIAREVSGVNKYRYVWYTCYSRKASAPPYMKRSDNCPSKRWKEEVLNNLVISKLKELDFESFELESVESNTAETVYIEELSKLDKQRNRLIDLYMMESIDTAMLDKRMQDTEAAKQAIQDKINNLKSSPLPIDELKQLSSFDWDSAPIEEQIKMMDALVERVEVSNKSVDVFYRF